MSGLRLLGTGRALPSRPVTNDDMSAIVETSDEWIASRTGIRQRYFCAEGETAETLAIAAARQALARSGVDAQDVGCVVCATSSGTYAMPSMACQVHHALGLAQNIPVMDVGAACAGFLYAVETARCLMLGGAGRYALVVGSEQMSRVLDMTDRATCVLFGDGAGAVLVEATEEEGVGVQNSYLRTDGKGLPFLHMKAGGSVCPASPFTVSHRLHYLYQEGRTVFRYAVTDMSNDVAEIMKRNDLTADTVNWVVPHEANLRIIEAVTKRVGIPMEKVMVNIQHYGNTSAATIPLALWDYEKELKKGDNIVFTAFGAGFVHGASFYKWGYDGAAAAALAK